MGIDRARGAGEGYKLKTFQHEDVQCARVIARLLFVKIPVYLFFVDGLLVDTGPSALASEILSFYKSLDIKQVAITHLHEDHCGLADYLVKERGVPVYTHPDSVEEAAKDAKFPFYRRLIWKERVAFSARAIGDVLETPNHRFNVIRVPGHTSSHLAFHEPERGWLFTGDFFLTSRPILTFRDEDVPATMESLIRLLELDFDVLFCSHSGVINRGKVLMEGKLRYLEELRGRIMEMTDKGMSERRIVKALFPMNRKRTLIQLLSGGEWSSRNMVRSLSGRKPTGSEVRIS